MLWRENLWASLDSLRWVPLGPNGCGGQASFRFFRQKKVSVVMVKVVLFPGVIL